MICLYCRIDKEFAGLDEELYTYLCPKCGDRHRENVLQTKN